MMYGNNPFVPPPDPRNTPALPPSPDDRPSIPTDPVVRYRLSRFLDIGFTTRQAERMAYEKEIDTHHVEKMVAAGCDLSLAFDIVT